jgi:UDP-N-acetylglucosamine 2-epimerase (non-hydrolysing)
MTQDPAKILVIFGTRPEAIKMFPIVAALRQDARFAPVVCVSAQHRGMLDQVLEIAGITPDFDLDLMRPNQTLDGLTAALITELGQVMDKVQPARVMVQGDTATAMAGALAAYYRKIPVDHVEAGLRSGNIYHPWPEEVNRKMIGAMASLHFAPTTTAQAALLRENVDSARVFVTGNSVIDALLWVGEKTRSEPALAGGLAELEVRFAGKRIIGVTSHRRENFGSGMENIAQAIRQIAERPDVAVIFPVHLNPNVRAVMNTALAGLDNVALIEPLDYPHFARLIAICEIMLTDSGGVQEEAPALGKPVLVMRETTERPEGVEAGTAKLVGTDSSRIVSEIFSLLNDKHSYEAMARAHNPFGDGQTARRIVEILGHEIGSEA